MPDTERSEVYLRLGSHAEKQYVLKTVRLFSGVILGAVGARDSREAFALGCVYTRAGLEGRAREAYERAAGVAIDIDGVSELNAASLPMARSGSAFSQRPLYRA